LGRQVDSYHIPGNLSKLDIPTYYCEPLARINKSQDPVLLQGSLPFVQAQPYTALPDGIKDARLSTNRIPENLNNALDIAGAQAAAACTGKLFVQVCYNWPNHYYEPSLGSIVGIEFSNSVNNAIQVWNIGLQGALHF
jgi:hypothetical protein